MLSAGLLKDIETRLKESTPGNWTGSSNQPFYATIDKPAPSLSKHDRERPHYWRIADVTFVLAAHNHDVPKLLEEVKRLKKLVGEEVLE